MAMSLKPVLVLAIAISLTSCDDGKAIYNFGKSKYDEAINRGNEYADSINQLNSAIFINYEKQTNRCTYVMIDGKFITIVNPSVYYKCDSVIDIRRKHIIVN